MAQDARLERLVSQAKAAIARADQQEEDRLYDEIYALTTGLDPTVDGRPEHLSNVEYQRKLCPYRKAIAPLYTDEGIEYTKHEMRLFALQTILLKHENNPYIQAIVDCVQDNGELVLEARGLRDGLVWAKKFNAANNDELQATAQEYGTLTEQYPNYELYLLLVELVDSKVKANRSKLEAKEAKQRLNDMIYQMELVEKADKGDLAAQLEVARRLETGDKFQKNHHFAYLWYSRALQNGGGEAAQSAMDRLRPELSEDDLLLVEIWLENNALLYE